MKTLSLLCLLTLISCASKSNSQRQRDILLENKEDNKIDTSELNAYPEIHLADESALQEINTTEGIVEDAYFTANDSSRFGLGYNLSLDFESPTKVQSFDFIYSSRISESYRQYWWSVHFQKVTANYSAIAEENPNNGDLKNDDSQSLNIFGLGIGHRFRGLAGTMSPRYFENVNVFANYISHNDTVREEPYQGYGYSAEYTLSYRSGESLTYGAKFGYNWAFVDRKKTDKDEKLEERSLVFGWSTLGFELGYYF